MDVSAAPWLTFGQSPQPPEETPKLGWMTESMEIDPFDSDRMMYGTGATVYGTTDLTRWDAGGQITIRPMAAGLEETAVLDLVSPPTGAPLISALGDIGGFRHSTLDAVPATMFTGPVFTSTTSLDYAELNPSVVVRAGDSGDRHVAFSTDGGANWFPGTEPGGVTSGGTIAASADGSRFVWAPHGVAPVYSVGFGTSWSPAAGLPTDAVVESDRVNPARFYGFGGGRFYASGTGGTSFAATAASGLPTGTVKFKAVPGREGDIWLAGEGGLFHSTDGGTSFARQAAVSLGINVGFGKAAPGRSYPAVFLAGTVDGVTGVFRSDDAGGAWVRINDDAHRYGNMGEALTGDPRVYGRVYLGTNGRGILVADRLGGPGPSPSASPSPSACLSVPGLSVPVGRVRRQRTGVTNAWTGGFQAEVTVRNTGPAALSGWTVGWTFGGGQTIAQLWNGTHTQTGAAVTVRNASWNGSLAPGAETTFGFLGSGPATPAPAPLPPATDPPPPPSSSILDLCFANCPLWLATNPRSAGSGRVRRRSGSRRGRSRCPACWRSARPPGSGCSTSRGTGTSRRASRAPHPRAARPGRPGSPVTRARASRR